MGRGRIRDRYLVGMLSPSGTVAADPAREDSAGVEGDAGDGMADDGAGGKPSLFPSSLGLTFAVDGSVTGAAGDGEVGPVPKGAGRPGRGRQVPADLAAQTGRRSLDAGPRRRRHRHLRPRRHATRGGREGTGEPAPWRLAGDPLPGERPGATENEPRLGLAVPGVPGRRGGRWIGGVHRAGRSGRCGASRRRRGGAAAARPAVPPPRRVRQRARHRHPRQPAGRRRGRSASRRRRFRERRCGPPTLRGRPTSPSPSLYAGPWGRRCSTCGP